MYQKFRNQFLSFSMYQSECLGFLCAQEVCVRGGGQEDPARSPDLKPVSPGFVQFLQYYYQSGCLYRLRALGERHTMDLTVGELARPCPAALGCRGQESPFLLLLA